MKNTYTNGAYQYRLSYYPQFTLPSPLVRVEVDESTFANVNRTPESEPTTERNIPVAQPVDADCYYCGDRPATQLEDQPPKCNACRRKWQR